MGEAADGARQAEARWGTTLGDLLQESELYLQRYGQWEGEANQVYTEKEYSGCKVEKDCRGAG